jgi:hypothetical protein
MAAESIRILLRPDVSPARVAQLIDNLAAGADTDMNFFNDFVRRAVIQNPSFDPSLDSKIIDAEWEENAYRLNDARIARGFSFETTSYKHTEIAIAIISMHSLPNSVNLRQAIATHLAWRDALYELYVNIIIQSVAPSAVLRIDEVVFNPTNETLYFIYAAPVPLLVQQLESMELIRPADFSGAIISVANNLNILQDRIRFVHRNLNINYVFANGAFIHLRDSKLTIDGQVFMGIGSFNRGRRAYSAEDLYLLMLTLWAKYARKLSVNSMVIIRDFFGRRLHEDIQKRFNLPSTYASIRTERKLHNVRMVDNADMISNRPNFFREFIPHRFIETFHTLLGGLPGDDMLAEVEPRPVVIEPSPYLTVNTRKHNMHYNTRDEPAIMRSLNAYGRPILHRKLNTPTLNFRKMASAAELVPRPPRAPFASPAGPTNELFSADAIAGLSVPRFAPDVPPNMRPLSRKNITLARRGSRTPNNRTKKMAKLNNGNSRRNVPSSNNNVSSGNNENSNNEFEVELPEGNATTLRTALNALGRR